MRIVLIEDNELLARGVENALLDLGYAVDCLVDGTDGSEYLAKEGADVAIIDINLPGLNGFEIVKAMRMRGDSTPVLILTARTEIDDRVTGLDGGADDYLIKPFSMAELAARVRALARRRPEMKAIEECIGGLRYDRASRRLFGPDGEIETPRRELSLFEFLLDNIGRVVSKESIGSTLYGIGSEIEPNAVELLVSRLRRKLIGTGVEIRTARGLGYMLDSSDEA